MSGAAQRLRANAPPGLERLFRPEAIAVVGASETPGAVGQQVVDNLQRLGFRGRIYPVNPKYERLFDLPCFSSLKDLPEVPDVVAVAVPARLVPAAIEEAGAAGIPYAVVYASGFAETGEAGRSLQDAVTAAARRHGLRLIGPNCQGYMNIAERIHVGFGPPYRLTYRSGRVGVVSQSGAFGNSLIMGMSAEGIGLRRYVSTGNEAECGALDLIEGMLEDPETAVVAGYIEGFRDAASLRRLAARAAERDVPLVLWKVGTSRAGAKAAASHTANLAGDPAFYKAAFRQLGIVEANDVGDMADCIRALLSGRRAAGPRVGVVTISGGAGVAMADRAEELGLELPALADTTIAALRETLPAFASFANPLDVTAGALTSPDTFEAALATVAADPAVDMLALAFAAASGSAATTIARALEALAAKITLPIAVAWNAPREGNEEAYGILERANLPVFATPGRAIRGLSATHRFGQARLRQDRLHALAADGPARTVPTVRTLDEAEGKTLLDGTGISAPAEAAVATAEEARAAAARIGWPVVMKLLSAAVLHKSDVGGVRVGLTDEAGVAAAFEEIRTIGREMDPAAPEACVLVQAMIRGGVEVIVGARIDEVFGPMVLFGAGGVYAELLSDVAFRLAPIDEAEARTMIGEARIARILQGARGRPPLDVDALAGALAGLSRLVAAPRGRLREVEINPLFVLPRGEGVVAGDCVARVVP